MAGDVCGGSLGCEFPQSCGLRGHVRLIEYILPSCDMKCMNMLCVNPFSRYAT